MQKLVLTCASLFLMSSAFAQTLFTYGPYPVSKQEFVRIYEKNSINKKADFTEPALREYLNLYSLFRMKVKEAEIQRLDTMPSIQHELDNYRKQLAKNYLTDEQVTNKLVREAYDRMKEEVRVEHILIMCPLGADTTEPYHRIDSLYKVARSKKADFGELAKQYSEDKGSKDNGGDIGYITALSTVYPFENAAYNTEVGKVSAPFKTQFGYHIVKVLDKRPANGQIRIEQIMVAVPKSRGQAGIEAGRKRIDSVAMMLRQDVPFETLVKEYSDDKFSMNEGGKLPPFGVGHYVPVFENAAFALRTPGDVSPPVQTEYGFHIFKLLERMPVKPYDSVQATLKHRIDNDSRAQTARDIFFEKIKQNNGFKEYPGNEDALVAKMDATIPDTGKQAHVFKATDYRTMTKPVFDLAGVHYSQADLARYMESTTHGRLMGSKKAVSNDLYRMYINTVVNDFEEHKLIEENPDFKNLMEEYRDGIMLFELMDRNVWGKASKDSVGLSDFYETHKGKYMWQPGFKGAVYHFKNETLSKEGIKLMVKKDATDEDVIKKINSDTNPDGVSVQRGHFEFSHFKDVPQVDVEKAKISAPYKAADGTYYVVKTEELYKAPTQKSLDEARGYVVAEYQDYLEKQWHEQLRTKYPVKVNEVVFKSLVR
jgi:peptidyl-prolyl cis-trans isomerase SurA